MQRWMPSIRNYFFITSNLERCYMLYNLRCLHSTEKCSSDVNVLDDFSIRLSKEKSQRWKQIQLDKKAKREANVSDLLTPWKFDLKSRLSTVFHYSKNLNVDIRNMSRGQIDALFVGAVESGNLGDVEYLIGQCVKGPFCPSIGVLCDLLSLYSYRGDATTVTTLVELCRQHLEDEYQKHYQLRHFSAKLVWMKGDIEKAVQMFMDLWSSEPDSRSMVRQMLKYMINETVAYKSEASTVQLTRGLKEFGSRCNEWIPLTYLWEYCWRSEWFGDNQLAQALFNENQPIRSHLADKLPALSSVALSEHQEDSVVRLLQMLLHNKMMFPYTRVLENLFIYKYKRDDVFGCHQIVRSCRPLNIKLRGDLQTKYLTLLISHGYIVRQPPSPPTSLPGPPSIKYRF